jgi:hypothetical protein
MRCPNCGQENAETSAFCFECGTRLKEEAAQPPAGQQAAPAPAMGQQPLPPPAVPAAVPAPDPPTLASTALTETVLTNRGQVFGLGYGPDFYAVWDLRTAGEPVARFDASPIGWEAAWRRFHDLERVHAIPAWRRPAIGWILLHVAIGLVGLAFVQGFLIGFVLALAGKDLEGLATRTGAGLSLAVLTGVAAWLLFVYLRKSPAVRWTVFLALLLAGFVTALVMGLINQPAATG